MSEKISRESLIYTLNMVRPALSNQSFVPILTHFAFQDEMVTAYNDMHAISVRCDAGITCAIPGDLMIRMLSSLSSEAVEVIQDESNIVLKGGRSKLKLPTLPVSDFTFDYPKTKVLASVVADADFLLGVEKCLISVGSDTTHPAQMGVTLEQTDKGAFLYSTDNFTLSRYKLAGPSEDNPPIILPTFFCQELIALGKAFPNEDITISVYDGAVVADIGTQAKLFTKQVFETEPLDFSTIMRKFVDLKKLKSNMLPIPLDMHECFPRATLVLGSELDKVSVVTVHPNKVGVFTESPVGEVRDTVMIDTEVEESYSFSVDPMLVTRAMKVCTGVALLEKVLVFMDDGNRFVHLISHVHSNQE